MGIATIQSTLQVSRLLGVSVSCLGRSVWEGRIGPVPKGPGGAYCWGPKHIQQASWVLRGRNADDVLAGAEGGNR